MVWLVWVALAALVAFGTYVRLAPSDHAVWHVDPAKLVPDDAGWRSWVLYPPGPTEGVVAMDGGAYAAVFLPDVAPAEVLDRLAAIAEATSRTRRLAWSVDQLQMTWVTRSPVWGFPDFTTARAEWRISDGKTYSIGNGTMLYIVARQRFGRTDFGVNAARLRDWLGKFDAP